MSKLPALLALVYVTIFSFLSCVSEYPLDSVPAENFLVIDAVLNYSEGADSNDLVVKLVESVTASVGSGYQAPVAGAIVSLIVNDKTTVFLPEREKGNYYLFDKSIFKPGNSFKLSINKGNDTYESKAEVMPDTVAIQKVYQDYVEKITAQNTFEILVDVQDEPQKRNFYKWSITQWERQGYCVYCYTANRSENCSADLYATPGVIISRNRPCLSDCFDILKFNPNNAISDVFFDGKQLLRKSIGTLPLNFGTSCLIEVRQSTLTPQYFDFLELLKTQSQNTGGLADTPAALLTGNITNKTNPKQIVLGYFSVTNGVNRRYWLDRSGATARGITPLASINPPLPIPAPTPPSWSAIPCAKSKGRTPEKPLGWRD